MENKPPKFVRWAVLLGIVVLMNVFAFISISYIYPEPEYDQFCEMQNRPLIENEEQCSLEGGKWNAHQSLDPQTGKQAGYCDLEYECRMEYQDAQTNHAQNSFIALLIIGAVAILAGMFLKGSSIVAAGLSYGGVALLIVAGARFLGDLDQLIQIIAVGIAFVLLIALAYRKFKD